MSIEGFNLENYVFPIFGCPSNIKKRGKVKLIYNDCESFIGHGCGNGSRTYASLILFTRCLITEKIISG